MGGGTTGQIQKAAKKQGTTAASWEGYDKYKRDKIDPLTTAAQRNIGEASSDAMSSFEQGVEGIGDFVERNTRSLMPQGGSDDQGSTTAEANYTSSSSGSKSGGQGSKRKGDLKQKKNKQNLSKKSLIKKGPQ
jgi:hypothetical protein|tara:strand:- start:218 stop:616 length:399 start_codon:yes stop_codon:yes gene_type:complete